MSSPLAGYRVLDMTRVIAGPVASRVLSSLGATVIRVSAPGLAQVPQVWIDTGFGKYSVDADIADRALSDALRRLANTADVVIQGYRPGGGCSESLRGQHRLVSRSRQRTGKAFCTQPPLAIAQPTVVLWGERDPVVPIRCADRLDEYFQDVVLERLPGAGHFIPRESPADVVEAIRRVPQQMRVHELSSSGGAHLFRDNF
jgi:pimeloyl-ACP methyl ester carboxylesterase